MIDIEVTDHQSIATIDPRPIHRLLKHVFETEGFPEAEVSIALVDNEQIHKVNRDFLNHDYPTDVISFVLNGSEDSVSHDHEHADSNFPEPLIGEVIVSVETAAGMAVENNWCIASEVLLYCLHGSLHLCGYDDLVASERNRMRERERFYLLPLGLDPQVDPTT